jgi:hypothetical protein
MHAVPFKLESISEMKMAAQQMELILLELLVELILRDSFLSIFKSIYIIYLFKLLGGKQEALKKKLYLRILLFFFGFFQKLI